MKQTIKFLDVLDIERRRTQSVSYHQASQNKKHSVQQSNKHKQKYNKFKSLLPITNKKSSFLNRTFLNQQRAKGILTTSSHKSHHNSKFPFFKALNFKDSKFQQYPQWLTQRDDFMPFMYKNYQSKLLTIPKICEKLPKQRASDQKYFISLYLQQIEIFQSLPQLIMDYILTQIKTKKYQVGQIIHNENKQMQFMAVIFVGSVQFQRGKKVIKKQRNQIIMNQAFYKKDHPTIVAKEQTVLLCLNKNLYKIIQSELKDDIYEKNRAEISDMMKSDFFVQLHLKQKRAKTFYQALVPQFYFKNEEICQAGQEANYFYLHFKGQVLEQNHIYIRQHNKWPLPNRRWQVRAVYNSYQNQNYLKQFSFFGDEQIIGQFKFKSSYYAKSFCIIYSMPAQEFKKSLTVQDFKRLKKYRNEHVDINYSQFEQKIRNKVHSQLQKKKIIRKAIDTSYANKTNENLSPRKQSLLQNIESNMYESTLKVEKQNEQGKIFFK